MKEKITQAVGGVLLQTCPGLPSRRPLSGIHLPGAHQVDISPLSAIPQLFGLGFIGKIGNGFDYWFTFIINPGVDPTNNRAERALRPHVVFVKGPEHAA